jgi:small subunit ribosomal protein S9
MKKDLVVSGKRKTAIAKAMIKEGNGLLTLNKRKLEFYPELKQLELIEPIEIAKDVLGDAVLSKIDIIVNVKGGGLSSRIGAARLAIARALVEYTKKDELKQAFIAYDRNLIVADTRRKEAYKPGDSKARASRQSSKR